MLSFLIEGAILGLSIAAPVGPIGILCIRRTMHSGRRSGIASGMGASVIHALYGAIGAFGLTIVSNFLIGSQFWLKLFGGIFLIFLGIKIFRAIPKEPHLEKQEKPSLIKQFLSTLLLAITNPMTMLTFIAIFAGLGLEQEGKENASAYLFVLGVFIGSVTWWVLLTSTISLFRKRINQKVLKAINYCSGIIIAGFGLFTFSSLFF